MPKPKTKRFWVIVFGRNIVPGVNSSTRRGAWREFGGIRIDIPRTKRLGYRAVRARLEVE